jgi:hypothetical protein
MLPGAMHARLDCIVSPRAQEAIDSVGRTEDLMFSPDGRRLAIAGYLKHRIVVFDVGLLPGRRVLVSGVVELDAATLREPHGLCFVDDTTIAVANRLGDVQLYEVPASGGTRSAHLVQPTRTITGGSAAPIRTPGSVTAHPLDDRTVELLVCNNYVNVVTRHVLDRFAGYASVRDQVLLGRGLDIPDSVCVSPAGGWIAVSNHNSHEVFLYRRTPALDAHSEPDGVLRNVICPHGVRFTRDERHVLVADAHARYVNVYARGDGDWAGVHDPVRMLPVLDWRTFLRGRSNPQEGGPKGIDLDPGMQVLACTSEFQTLAFFDLAQVLAGRRAPVENRVKRYVQWRLGHAIHRRSPAIYGWLRPFWR